MSLELPVRALLREGATAIHSIGGEEQGSMAPRMAHAAELQKWVEPGSFVLERLSQYQRPAGSNVQGRPELAGWAGLWHWSLSWQGRDWSQLAERAERTDLLQQLAASLPSSSNLATRLRLFSE